MELTNNTSKEEIEQLKEYSEDFDSLKKGIRGYKNILRRT